MKKLSKIITVTVLILVMTVSFAPIVNAATTQIYIKPNQQWSAALPENRDTSYSYVWAKCIEVAPLEGIDLFSRIQCAVFNKADVNITAAEIVRLPEASFVSIKLKEGYLGLPTVYFKFRGNSSADALATVEFRGTPPDGWSP